MAKSFLKDRAGNIGLSFAVLSLPMLLAGGLAVDYIGLSVHRTSLQNAVDAAALAVAREGRISEEAALDIAIDTVAGNFADGRAFDVEVKLVGDDVTVRANAEQPLMFGGFIGSKTMPVGAVATATYASTR
ncbi:pilus assembly protein TadG-related protein [Hoeflea marina]|nr:pilus assembly protein TadG-related protein [Hoeflea marina]